MFQNQCVIKITFRNLGGFLELKRIWCYTNCINFLGEKHLRTSGILMPIFSLSTDYGIGTLGKEAYEFVDFLKQAGQSYWQILPLSPTSFGDSPYQSFSSYAGNPYFIDLDILCEKNLLKKGDYENIDFGENPCSIDYEKLYNNRYRVLKIAFNNFDCKNSEYQDFCEKEAHWLQDYALFMAIKDYKNGEAWYNWEKPLKFRSKEVLEEIKDQLKEDIEFYKFLQAQFFSQWEALKKYANEQGIKIIGDMPIYVAHDSADVWSKPEQFLLDKELTPTLVAGCPPDAFTDEGQLWGNPVYDWEYMKKEKTPYSWWRNRIKFALRVYDVVRIDHFRGFESFYTVKYGEKTAKNGSWLKGPDMELFKAIKQDFKRKKLPIIAEDLGFLTPQVEKLLKNSGFPGMKVLQFAFDGDAENQYLPHNYNKNCVVYTGTHDNNTVNGWVNTANSNEVHNAKRYMNPNNNEGFNWTMIKTALMSVADTAIIMMPDLLGLGSEARINTPSTVGDNWKWRIEKGCINPWLAGIVKENTEIYGRASKI